MKRGRKPRADELELWRKVEVTAVPLESKRVFEISARTEPSAPAAPTPAAPAGAMPAAPQPQTAAPAMPPAVRMDAKAFTRLRKGKLRPDARLDLHGMSQSQAHDALNSFVLRSHSRGHRLLLIITGKGSGDAARTDHWLAPRGVLRQAVPHWLNQPPVGSVVLQTTQAHPRHGGNGALYVYLRRSR